ncbi:MAG: DUF309 domain-containing protein, partial [Anaerolineales bacterium]|nr:DUF309 domain-containing protein [Anaerolineales bacterium]
MNISINKPCVLGFVSDLYFSTRIDSVADRLGFEFVTIEEVEYFQSKLLSSEFHGLNIGIKGSLLEVISNLKPVLIIFDLNNHSIPWEDWIKLISIDPATRRIPIISYSSHKDLTAIDSAKKNGAKVVFARSRFISDLPNIISKFANLPDVDGIESACQDPLDGRGIIGLEKFNQGRYFEAHEYLEQAWMEDNSVGRNLYRALLQVAVAYYQISRGNFRGAFKMFLRLRQWLDHLPNQCRGVNIAKLREEVRLVHEKLIDLGSERIGEFD